MGEIKLLLVDDEAEYVRTMAARLAARDVPSEVALSGEEALQKVAAAPPDVMVLDLRMPGVNGMEVLERVKREHPHVQVIILTGHGSEHEEREARRLGAFEYLEKPADTRQVLGAIKAAWKKGLALLHDTSEGLGRVMAAAAMAEAGEPELAREHLAQTEPEPPPEPPQAAPPAQPLKILFVDDEEDFVRTVAERMQLRNLGGDVALSGQQALAMLAADPPDVMVLDLRMPDIDGLEVLRRVKVTCPGVAVIIMTGHGSEQDEEEARRLGAAAYLRKPTDINELMQAVRAAVPHAGSEAAAGQTAGTGVGHA
jgi:DNA-binding NtrC family response regulator